MEKREIRNLHNHPSYIIESSWGAIFVLVMLVLNNGTNVVRMLHSYESQKNFEFIGMLGIFFLYSVLMIFFSFRRWKLTVLNIVDGSMTWEQNTIFAKKQEIALSTISNVNLEQNLFERLIGTYKLKIDTSSLSTANKTDMKIILGKEDAFMLQNMILQLMRGESFEEEANIEEVVQGRDFEEQGIEKKQNLSAMQAQSAKNPEAMQDAASSADIQEKRPFQEELPFQENMGKYAIEISAIENIQCALASINESMLGIVLSLFLIAVILFFAMLVSGAALGEAFVSCAAVALAAGGFAKNIGKKFLYCYNYKVRRSGKHIYISSGAIKKQSYSVPVDKIQAFRLNKTLLGRLMHRTSVSVINIGGEQDDVNGQLLLPAVLDRDLPAMLAKILPEYHITAQEELCPRPKRVLWRKQLVNLFTKAVFVILSSLLYTKYAVEEFQEEGLFFAADFFVVMIPLVGCLWILWNSINLFLAQKTEGIKIADQLLTVRRGGFSWEQIEIPYDKIQQLTTKQDLLKRFMHTKVASIHMLASALANVQKIPEFDAKQIEQLQEKFQSTILA